MKNWATRWAGMTGLLFLLSCSNGPEMKAEKVDPDSIYLDYLVWGDEESNTVTLKLQYRGGGPNERAILLQEPARIELDGQVLIPDSTRFAGPYYEVISPATDFEGTHELVFTDRNGRKYVTKFEYSVISLKDEVADTIGRDSLVLGVNNWKKGQRLRLLMTDTSYYGSGVEKVDTFVRDRLIIDKNELSNLHNGPIHMELISEEDKALGETMAAGGRFYLTYSLSRNVILLDSVR